MIRIGLFSSAAILLIGTYGAADPPPEANQAFKNALLVQQAQAQAKEFIFRADYAKAVQVLEEHLARINGNHEYLRLLRNAYRGHIQDLLLASQEKTAQLYLERLAILDRDAARDPALRPYTVYARRAVAGTEIGVGIGGRRDGALPVGDVGGGAGVAAVDPARRAH